jgi:hypothetical protein
MIGNRRVLLSDSVDYPDESIVSAQRTRITGLVRWLTNDKIVDYSPLAPTYKNSVPPWFIFLHHHVTVRWQRTLQKRICVDDQNSNLFA